MIVALVRLTGLLFSMGIIFLGTAQVAGSLWNNPIVALVAEEDAYNYDLQTHVIQSLTPNRSLRETRLVWSPDHRHLAANDQGGTRTLNILNLETGLRTKLHDFVGDFRWSQSGELIAFTGLSPTGRDILIAAPDGSGRRNLTRNGQRNLLLGWGADDQSVIYMNRSDDRWHIMQTHIRTRATQTLFSINVLIGEFALSPDAQYFAYTAREDTASTFALRTIDGKLITESRITRAGLLAWSPDSRYIAVSQYNPAIEFIPNLMVYDRESRETAQQYLFPEYTIQSILWQTADAGLLVVGAHHLNATTQLFDVSLASNVIATVPFPSHLHPSFLTWNPTNS